MPTIITARMAMAAIQKAMNTAQHISHSGSEIGNVHKNVIRAHFGHSETFMRSNGSGMVGVSILHTFVGHHLAVLPPASKVAVLALIIPFVLIAIVRKRLMFCRRRM
jgi:hypothetical protein